MSVNYSYTGVYLEDQRNLSATLKINAISKIDNLRYIMLCAYILLCTVAGRQLENGILSPHCSAGELIHLSERRRGSSISSENAAVFSNVRHVPIALVIGA